MKPKTKDQAIEQVIENNPESYSGIMQFAKNWVTSQNKAFTIESLKKAYFDSGFESPKQVNIWGAISTTLYKEGRIIHHGFELAKNPIARSRILRVWISKEFSELQANNRRLKPSIIFPE